MDGIFQDDPRAPRETETPDQRATRIKLEMAVIGKGHADIDAGLGIDLDDLEVWFKQLETDDNAPMPGPRSAIR